MVRINYEPIAAIYDQRYETNEFSGLSASLNSFIGASHVVVGEVGCGTAHWLKEIESRCTLAVGLDLSQAMLTKARDHPAGAVLVQGRAEMLPFSQESFDRLYCINALHHFDWPNVFVKEAKRALRHGGGLLTVGLDPHTGLDQWWIYDYFPSALIEDRKRYLPAQNIRDLLDRAGFVRISTYVAQRIRAAVPFEDAWSKGLLDRRSTSQLQVIDDQEWKNGYARLRTERPVLHADLRLYATIGWSHLESNAA
jgi:ubiquinone/menaquinone biosynthesis C-methylase UbiE